MKEANVCKFQQKIAMTIYDMVDISVNICLETHIYSHLNKNKVNTKIVSLRPTPYTLRYLKLNAYNVCTINAKSFNLW